MLKVRNLTRVCLAELANRIWRQLAPSATSAECRKRVRVPVAGTGARVRRRWPPSPTVTSTATCPLQQCKEPSTGIGRVALPTSWKEIGRQEEPVVSEPWNVAMPTSTTPLWRDSNAGNVVDPRQVVQRLPQPFDPPDAPANETLEKDLRQLFDEMSRSGDVVFRVQAGPEPGQEHIECCDALTNWTLRHLGQGNGDKDWRTRIERLVYKVLFEYIMKLYFGDGCVDAGSVRGPEQGPPLDMLRWLKEVATDPTMCMLPEMSEEWQRWWNMNVSFCNQQNLVQDALDLNEPPYEVRLQDNFTFFKKMAIRAREALFTRAKDDLPIEESPKQTSKKQKLHHYFPETSRATAEISPDNMDSSLVGDSRSDNGSASSDGMPKQPKRRPLRALALLNSSDYQRKHVPIGPAFQADVPEWKDPTCETHLLSGDEEVPNDSRRSGTQVWPMEDDFPEASPEATGKGRPHFCVCPSPRSASCVRYHITESRSQLKLTFGQAFNDLGLSDMGEEIASSWTLDEQLIFDALVKLNPLSENKSFLGPALTFFGSKSGQDIVSYYFNVFILRRVGIQTRLIGGDVDSDNDDYNVDAYEDLYPRVLHKRIIQNS